MDPNGKIILNQLPADQKIKVYRLEHIDDSLFNNYQRYDFFQLLWFTHVKGDPHYFLDFKEYELKDNQFVLVFPGQIDRLDTEGKEGFLFAIQNDSFFRMSQRINSDYLNGYLSNIFLTPNLQTTTILNQLIDLIFLEYENRNRQQLMESYMEAFLFHVASLTENRERNSNDFLISRLMRLIDIHFITHHDTEFYASELGLSLKRINEECKKGTGKTIKQHIQERLILEIKKEIHLNKKSLKEISFDLGFSEPAYFSRFFKQHTTISPKEYRLNQNQDLQD